MNIIGFVLYTLFFAFLSAHIAQKKLYNHQRWFILGILLGPLALIVILTLNKK